MPGGLQMHFWQQLLPTRAGNVSLPACLPRPTEAHHTYALATDDGRMMAISQNINWDILQVRSEKLSFQWIKQLNDGNHGEGTLSAKMGLITEKTPINTPKCIPHICLIGTSLKKKLYWSSVVLGPSTAEYNSGPRWPLPPLLLLPAIVLLTQRPA